VYEFGGNHPFDSLQASNPLASKCGIYCHLTTKRHKKTGTFESSTSQSNVISHPTRSVGEIITTIYVGSAQGRLRENEELLGIRIRVDTYATHEKKSLAKDFDQAYINVHEDLSEHANHYPYDEDEHVVINSAWWVAMAQTRLQHFTALCKGDAEAGRWLTSLFLNDTKRMPVSSRVAVYLHV
jgi:hypothetical protein